MLPRRFLLPVLRDLPRLLPAVLVAALFVSPVAAQQNSASWWSRYEGRVTATQNEQPHWVTPLVTVTPRLEQEVRTDFVRQTNTKGQNTWNYGNSKGLEIIPFRRVELLFNLPPFFNHEYNAK